MAQARGAIKAGAGALGESRGGASDPGVRSGKYLPSRQTWFTVWNKNNTTERGGRVKASRNASNAPAGASQAPAGASLADYGADETARWEKLSRRFRAPLASYFSKRVRDVADVDDLIQDVFVRLLGRSREVEIARVEHYVFRTAENVLKDRARRDATHCARAHEAYDETLHGAAASDAPSPERVLIGRDRVRAFAAVLAEMPARRRTVFIMHRFEGLKYSEIAERLGLTMSAVEKHMLRAHAFIDQRMGGER